MTDEKTQALIRAYIEERRQAEALGNPDTVAAIDEQLRLIGHKAQAPAKRAAKRTQAAQETR